MGAMHLKGELGGTDLKAALSFFKQAAEKGHNHAMKNLGCCYLEGIGTPINIQTAIHWLQQSVDKGCEQAIPALGFAYYSQDPHNSGRYLELMEKALPT
jgi:TPR repeat protein